LRKIDGMVSPRTIAGVHQRAARVGQSLTIGSSRNGTRAAM